MLTKNNIKQIGDLIDEKLEKKLDEKFDEKIGELAIMIQNGFAECANKKETQENFDQLKREVAELRYEVYRKKGD